MAAESALETIRTHLPAAGTPLLIACSGGCDSMTLWFWLAEAAAWPLWIYHLDHGLRADSQADVDLVRRQARRQRLGKRCLIERWDIQALAAEWRCGVEEAGRRQRYARLTAQAQAQGIGHVLTAHHADDQVETILAHLLRGADAMGASGMRYQRELAPGIQLVRPLLACQRRDIEAWARQHAVPWREDSSNRDTRFARNYLRHVVLPEWEQHLPGIGDALRERAEVRRVQAEAAGRWVDAVWHRHYADHALALVDLDLSSRRQRSFLWRHLLLWCGCPLARRHVQALEDLFLGTVGRRFHLAHIIFRRERAHLAWSLARPQLFLPTAVSVRPGSPCRAGPWTLSVEEIDVADLDEHDPYAAYIDADAITGSLVWRHLIAGERWRPLGAPGSKSLRRYLGERGIAREQRDWWPMVADELGIVWVPGCTIAERVRLRSSTRRQWRLVQEHVPLVRDEQAAAASVETRRIGRLESRAAGLSCAAMQAYDTVSAVILAAGKGTRMGSERAKVLHRVGGKAMVEHVCETCRALGVDQSIAVVGHQAAAVQAVVEPFGVECVVQREQLGTGHAVLMARERVRGHYCLVLCGDAPLVPRAVLADMLALLKRSGAPCVALAAEMPDPSGYGRMIQDASGALIAIVEHKDADQTQRAVNLVNSGIYAFDSARLWAALARVGNDNAQGEYYLPDVVRILVAEGERVELVCTDDVAAVFGVNTPADLAAAEDLLAKRQAAD